MPLRVTSAPVAGVQKRKSSNPRSRGSPFTTSPRRKAVSQTSQCPKTDADYDNEFDTADGTDPLTDLGPSKYIFESTPAKDVVEAMLHVKNGMFETLPERAGMNSTRIAQVLNFRRSLPPLVSVAHVHTLLQAPTQVEREIVALVQKGRLRRLIVPGRGNDAAGLGDCLVLAEDLEALVRETDLSDPLKGRWNTFIFALWSETDVDVYLDQFLLLLQEIGDSTAVPASVFTPEDSRSLVRAGLLVSASSLTKGSLNIASLPALPPSLRYSAASRTEDRDNSDSNFTGSSESPQSRAATMFLSLPNIGPYLRLLGAGRAHLLALLRKSKYHQAPLYLLRDRWDGAVETDHSFSLAKRARGEFSGVLPGRTKKWKDLYGMSFRWVLEEALGAGLIELFETGSVGPGVRLL